MWLAIWNFLNVIIVSDYNRVLQHRTSMSSTINMHAVDNVLRIVWNNPAFRARKGVDWSTQGPGEFHGTLAMHRMTAWKPLTRESIIRSKGLKADGAGHISKPELHTC
jgi:hypothetical protein